MTPCCLGETLVEIGSNHWYICVRFWLTFVATAWEWMVFQNLLWIIAREDIRSKKNLLLKSTKYAAFIRLAAIHSTFFEVKEWEISRRPRHPSNSPLCHTCCIGARCGRLGSSHYGMAYHPSSALETPHQFSALGGKKSTSQHQKHVLFGVETSHWTVGESLDLCMMWKKARWMETNKSWQSINTMGRILWRK